MGEGLRRRIVRRLFENSRDWICRTVIRTTRNVQKLFLLPAKRDQVEGERQTQIPSNPIVHPKMNSGNRVPFRGASGGCAAQGEFRSHHFDA